MNTEKKNMNNNNNTQGRRWQKKEKTPLAEVLGAIWIIFGVIALVMAFVIGPSTGMRLFVYTTGSTGDRIAEMNSATSAQQILFFYFLFIAGMARIAKFTENVNKVKTPKQIRTKILVLIGIFLVITTIAVVNYKNQVIDWGVEAPKSVAGLKKVESEGILYYTDIPPNKEEELHINGTLDSVTMIKIEKLEHEAKLEDIEEKTVKKYYSEVKNTYLALYNPLTSKVDNDAYAVHFTPPSLNNLSDFKPYYTFKDVTVDEETFRGADIRRIKLFSFIDLLTDEDEIDIGVEMVYLPVKDSLVRVTIIRNNGSTELDKTFEHICNTIYTDPTNGF